MTDDAIFQEALKYVPRDQIVLACRYWKRLNRPKLRMFEWVVGKAFVTQGGLINLHGSAAQLFHDGETVEFQCVETGQVFKSKVRWNGVLLSGKGARCVAGFKGFAQTTQVVANVDRLLFQETERGKFKVTVRRLNPAFALKIKEVHKQFKIKSKAQEALLPLGLIKKYAKHPEARPVGK